MNWSTNHLPQKLERNLSKDSNHVYDFVVVGQGIAGTFVAHYLLKHTTNIMVLDAEEHTASFAAAGIINPITGRHYVKSWMIDTLLPFAIKSYDEIGTLLGFNAYNKLNIVRTIDSIKEQNDWDARKQDEAYTSYIVSNSDFSMLDALTQEPHKYGEVTQSLQVKLKEIITRYRAYLKQHSQFKKMKVDVSNISFRDELININGLQAKQIIFCEGHKAIQNPYFNHINFLPAKGNALIIKGEFLLHKNLKDKFFITPLEDGTHWVGSGYEWNTTDENPNEEEMEKMEATLKAFLSKPYTVIEKIAGIRPSVKNRRPVIGPHHLHSNLYIFNGLGTKGSSLAPYFANMLVESIFENTEIMPEVDIKQY
jgi:glycine oxidase